MTQSDLSILAIDTTGSACSAALWRGGRILSRHREEMARGQAERLLPMIDLVMREAGASFDSLSAVAVTVGPGAFTGVRIGLAAAKGLALALKVRIIGVTSFEAVASAVSGGDRKGRMLAVALESKRRDLYLQVFGTGTTPAGSPCAVEPERLSHELPPAPLLLAGDAKARAFAVLSQDIDARVYEGNDSVDAAHVAALAAARARVDSAPVRPLYLRPPDVSLPKGGRATID